jgi:hypothetical protein
MRKGRERVFRGGTQAFFYIERGQGPW